MLSNLIALDHWLFFLINDTLHHRAANSILEGLSSMGGWTVGLLTLVLLGTEGRRSMGRHLLVLTLFLIMTAAVNSYLKETIARPRPTAVFEFEPRHDEGPRIRVLELDAPRRYAFPSGHTMTAFFMLVYAGQRRRAFRPWFLVLATGTALGRIYVGVHFPLDCLAGAAIGASGALLASSTFHRLEIKLWIPTPHTPPISPTNGATANIHCA